MDIYGKRTTQRWSSMILLPALQAPAVQKLLAAMPDSVDDCDELGATALEKAF